MKGLTVVFVSLCSFFSIAESVAVDSAATLQSECSSEEENGCTTDGNVFDVFEKWVNGVKDQGRRFLEENVFNQGQHDGSNHDPFPHVQASRQQRQQQQQEQIQDPFSSIGHNLMSVLQPEENGPSPAPSKDGDDMLASILETVQKFAEDNSEHSRNFQQAWDVFGQFFGEAMDQMKKTFDHINFDRFNPIGMWYFVEHEDEVKNPSWKRRKHRFHASLPVETIQELHNALYLSHLSYASSVDGIRDGLKTFLNNSYELIYSKIESFPGEPAHFITIRKEAAPLKANSWPLSLFDETLEVMLIVRGTKEIGDLLSDGLLDAADFRGGKAHAGIAKAGQYLVDQHLDMLQNLLDVTKRNKIRLSLVGHSLGAGAAAIAAVLFNEIDWIEASSVGFGCPALLSWELSQSAKDLITTVITDSDVVPRMSGASISNMLLDVMSFDWTDKALEDIEMTLNFFNVPNRGGILKWANETFDKDDRPFFSTITKERREPVLFPPGTCVHLYRDGVGFSVTYTPCSFFDQIDVSRTMVDDHLIPTGYHRAFLDLLRDSKKDLDFHFEHDVMAVKI